MYIDVFSFSSLFDGRMFAPSTEFSTLWQRRSFIFMRTVLSNTQNRKKFPKACPGSPNACKRIPPHTIPYAMDLLWHTERNAVCPRIEERTTRTKHTGSLCPRSVDLCRYGGVLRAVMTKLKLFKKQIRRSSYM